MSAEQPNGQPPAAAAEQYGYAQPTGNPAAAMPAAAPAKGRLTGTCKNWSKGYGFITREDGAGDVFVHQTQIQKQGFRSLQIGETVEFEVETKADGRIQAVRVTGPNGVDVIGQERNQQQGYNSGGYGAQGGYGGGRGGYGGGRGGGYQAAASWQGGYGAPPYAGAGGYGYQMPQQAAYGQGGGYGAPQAQQPQSTYGAGGYTAQQGAQPSYQPGAQQGGYQK